MKETLGSVGGGGHAAKRAPATSAQVAKAWAARPAARPTSRGSVRSRASKVSLPEPLPAVRRVLAFLMRGGDAVSGMQLESNDRTIRSNGTQLSPLPLPGLWSRLLGL